MDITPQEQQTLGEGLRDVVEGIKDVRRVLTLIGERIDAEFSESSLYIASIASFYADQPPMPIDYLGKTFSADRLWKRRHQE